MTSPITIMAIDPSMTMSGYAVLRRSDSITVVDAGVLRPEGTDRINKIHSMVIEAKCLAAEYSPTRIIVELPMEFVIAARRGKRSAAHLPWYGVAIGAFLVSFPRDIVVGVTATAWGTVYPTIDKMKTGRIMAVRARYGQHLDLGAPTVAGNVADAIMMGTWWLDRLRETDGDVVVKAIAPPQVSKRRKR